jgi:hypothetical protein
MDAWKPFRRWAVLALTAGIAACGGGEPGDLIGEPIAASTITTAPRQAGAAAPASAVPRGEAADPADMLRPRIVQAPRDAELAADGVAEFSVRADGPPGLRYQWLRDGEPIDGAIGVNLQLHVTDADHLASFSVEVRAGALTVRSQATTLRVKAA